MTDINGFFFVGNVGHDPELKYTDGGHAVTRFAIACSRHKSSGEERKEETSWFNIIAWGKQAENVCKYLGKGSRVGVKGYVQQRIWKDREDQKHYEIEFISDQVQFLSSPKDKEKNISSQNRKEMKVTKQSYGKTSTGEVDEIPF